MTALHNNGKLFILIPLRFVHSCEVGESKPEFYLKNKLMGEIIG
jgi:hypothetical protein